MTTLSAQQWSQLLEKAAKDKDFREQLLTSPKTAARSIGIELDDASAAAIEKYLEAVRNLSEQSQPTSQDAQDWEDWALRTVHVPHKSAPAPHRKWPEK